MTFTDYIWLCKFLCPLTLQVVIMVRQIMEDLFSRFSVTGYLIHVIIFSGYGHGWGILWVCVGKMPLYRPFLSLRWEAPHQTAAFAPVTFLKNPAGNRGVSRRGEGPTGSSDPVVAAALVMPGPPLLSCYPRSIRRGLIVLYLWFIILIIKLAGMWWGGSSCALIKL